MIIQLHDARENNVMERDQNEIGSFKIETILRVRGAAHFVQRLYLALASRRTSQLPVQQNTGKRRRIKQI
ncbi:hypothetical protein D3C81_1757450 [compost metagenome]